MSYNTIAAMAQDEDLRLRVTACAAEQGVENPTWWVDKYMWNVAASPGWAASYEYALAVPVADPGKDEAVITDATILATVQPMLTGQGHVQT